MEGIVWKPKKEGRKIDFSEGKDRDKPEQGKQFVIVNITITNNTKEKQSYNPFDYKLNADGNATDMLSFLTNSENRLNSGNLDPGGTVSGNLYGEASTTAEKVKLQYQPSILNDETVNIRLN